MAIVLFFFVLGLVFAIGSGIVLLFCVFEGGEVETEAFLLFFVIFAFSLALTLSCKEKMTEEKLGMANQTKQINNLLEKQIELEKELSSLRVKNAIEKGE